MKQGETCEQDIEKKERINGPRERESEAGIKSTVVNALYNKC